MWYVVRKGAAYLAPYGPGWPRWTRRLASAVFLSRVWADKWAAEFGGVVEAEEIPE